MTIRPGLRAAAEIAMAVLLFGTALADGVPVMPWHDGGQSRPGLAADGAGGAWLAFRADSSAGFGIVRVRPDGLADASWPNGIYLTGLTKQPGSPTRVLASSADRVFVVSDLCISNELVTGYDAAGDPLAGFPASADLIYPAPGSVLGADGRILSAVAAAYNDGNSGVTFAVVSATGQLLAEAEVRMNYRVINAMPFQVIPDGAGGMFIGLPIYFASDYSTGIDVGLQRIAGDGTRPWGNGGKVVCAVNANQTDLRMWPDGTGGALMSWTDARTSPAASPFDIYAARFTSAGLLATGWTSQGKRVGAAAGAQLDSRIVGDGAGGAWILWRDERVADIDLYCTHVLANGAFAPGFTLAGTLLCGAAGAPTEAQMVPDGAGGFFAVWLDPRDGEGDLYGTHITGAGAPAPGWPANGLALCDAPSYQLSPALVATGVGKAMVAWRDERLAPGHVYTLALGENGPQTTEVAPAPGQALRLRAASNPSVGLSDLWVVAPAGEEVEVELFDVTGRAVRRESVAGASAETRVRFAGGALSAGLYFASARQGALRATVRLCVLQ